MKTKDRLAEALDNAGLTFLADQARKGMFDDFESPLAMPITALAHELQKVGTSAATELRRRVVDGEFDGTKEEADEWAASQEGRDIMNKLRKGEN